MYTHMILTYVYNSIYIYTCRERERDKYIYIYLSVRIHTILLYAHMSMFCKSACEYESKRVPEKFHKSIPIERTQKNTQPLAQVGPGWPTRNESISISLQDMFVQQKYPTAPPPLAIWCYLFVLYGGFLKWGYPQIIHFDRIVHYKPSIWGYLIYGNPHISTGFPFST